MPPKSKKEQQEQAKRLQEEQRKREEEEARLALQRKKYSHETIATGLNLPASNQLLLDLPHQSVQFVTQKLRDAAVAITPELANDQPLLKLVVKELLYYAVDSVGIFNLGGVKQVQGNEQQLLKARVLVGVALKVMINGHRSLGGSGKSKQADEQILKETIALHVSKGEGRIKLYNIKQVQAVLNCIKKAYFNHYLLLWNFTTFKKREDVQKTHVYISTACSFRNNKDTPFTDLSHKVEKNDHV